MRIQVVAQERVFEGTAMQIVEAMRSVAFAPSDVSLEAYMDWAVEQALSLSEVELVVQGETVQERAESFVASLLREGLVVRT